MPPSAACGFVPCRALDESASRITYRVVRFLGSTITFKRRVFTQVFYGKNCYKGSLTRLFAKEFPTVWETIRTIKKEDYKRLSRHMLRLEAEIIINRAVRRCALEGIWVVTIHDCLVTFPELAERVSQIMEDAFGA